LQAAMAGKRLVLDMSGPGEARLAGTVDSVQARLIGSGALDGRKLSAAKTEVTVEGPGDAMIGAERFDRKGTRRTN